MLGGWLDIRNLEFRRELWAENTNLLVDSILLLLKDVRLDITEEMKV